MNNVDINKKYIREHVKENEQAEFYTFFSKLSDHHLFENWDLERTVEVVKNFRNQLNEALEAKGRENHTETKPPLEKLNSISPPESPLLNEPRKAPMEEKFYTSLNLLEEIEAMNAIKPENGSRKLQPKEQNWLNVNSISHLLASNPPPLQFNNDLFQTFDLIINKQVTPQPESNKHPARMSLPVIPTKLQSEKIRKNQSIVTAPGERTTEEKSNKGNLKDKLFKWRINETIKCKKLDNLVKCNRISINHHEMIHRIFLPDYAMYSLEVQPLNIICRRTYDDFVCLRNILQQAYPCVKIPYLQSGSWLSQNDIALINKNKNHLEMFMKGILEHPLLNKLIIVSQFISVIQHKQIKKYLQELEKVTTPKYLNEVFSETGEINIALSSEQYQLITELPKWQNIFEQYFQKYNDLLSNLTAQFETVHHSFTQLQKLSIEMQNTLKQLTQRKTEIERQEDFEFFFKEQELFYAKRQKETEEEIININEVLIPFIKYEKANINQFKPFFESVQKLTEKYLKRVENEPESPSSFEEIATLVAKNKFRDDIWQESENMQFFKLQLGYLHTTLLGQTHIFSNRLINNLKRVWSQLFGVSKQSTRDRISIKSTEY